MLKQVMIPVAALALTVTNASAFTGTGWIEKLDVDLSDAQVSALEQVEQIRQNAHTEAQEVLEAAGLDETKMREIRGAMRSAHKEQREAMHTALENSDYAAFVAAVADTRLADQIDSEAEFKKFVEAHELMEEGDREAAHNIMDELGIEGRGVMMREGGMRKGFGGPGFGGGRQSAESE